MITKDEYEAALAQEAAAPIVADIERLLWAKA